RSEVAFAAAAKNATARMSSSRRITRGSLSCSMGRRQSWRRKVTLLSISWWRRRSGCCGQPLLPGSHDHQPQHDRHLSEHKRLAIGENLVLGPWEQQAGNAERQPGEA